MKSLLEKFRSGARRSNRGRSRLGRRYSSELRSVAVRHLLAEQGHGRGLDEIAGELGVNPLTLRRWSEASSGFREVEVVDCRDAAASCVVVTPDGYRIEGLDAARAIEVVRALR